jgi:hypothetical protein
MTHKSGMTFPDLTRQPHQRGYNQELADFCGTTVKAVENWKQRKRIPDGYRRFIDYKLFVISAVGNLAKEISER